MIKPILYHSFEEKAKLEAELFGKLTPKERKRAAKAWMESAASAKILKEGRGKTNSPKRKK
jgi:hypothetical protein